MSKNELTASGVGHGEQSTDSVFDFLYYDARRVGSFLAQFDSLGHLQQITASESAMKGGRRGFHVKLGGSVPIPGSLEGAEASLGAGVDPVQGATEALARAYDPLWTNACTFLDVLDERRLLQRDIKKTRIGQFVLISGSLAIYDLSLLRKAWESESIEALARMGAPVEMGIPGSATNMSRQERRAQNKNRSQSQRAPSQIDIVLALLKLVPHGLQAKLESDGAAVWCGLRDEFLIGSASDLTLKHGASVAGTWSMVAILDTLPGHSAGAPEGEMDQLVASGQTSMGIHLAASMGPAARDLVGRPAACFGVTPLLIFREVSG